VIAPPVGKLSASPDFMGYMQNVHQKLGIGLTWDFTHVQATIIFCVGKVLERTNGFLVPGNHKIQAIVYEVAFSMVARHHEFRIGQLGFLPFEYITHPQWSDLRANMARAVGRIRRIINIVLRSWWAS
jgi:hypothetical protein